MIKLTVRPAEQVTWKEFCSTHPPRSIALDGYVTERPRFNPEGPWANFNHHENVARLETRATCAQVLLAMKQGLFQTFRHHDTPWANLYVNDCDEDVCLSVYIFEQYAKATRIDNPRLNRLVQLTDFLDSTGGMYPIDWTLKSLEQLYWVYQPYHTFRASGGISRKDPVEFEKLIVEVGSRIREHVAGSERGVGVLDQRYKKIGGGPVKSGSSWVMIKETGLHGRLGAFRDGFGAVVIAREWPAQKEHRVSHWTYTLARRSVFVQFPIPKIIGYLNKCGATPDKNDQWGGSDIIAGSPRGSGTTLDPKELELMINSLL